MIHWEEVRARLEASTEAIMRGGYGTAEQCQAVLRERARALAEIPAEPATQQQLLSVVGFRLGTRTFAADSAAVGEVFSYRPIVPVPCTPSYILGLVNARGQILSVTDLKVFFGIPATEPTLESKILVFSSAHLEFGVLVDGLYEVQDIAVESIERAARGPGSEFVSGTTLDGVTVLDVPKLMQDRRMVIGE